MIQIQTLKPLLSLTFLMQEFSILNWYDYCHSNTVDAEYPDFPSADKTSYYLNATYKKMNKAVVNRFTRYD
ncbi:MAG: hypothetical protein RM338_26670 [Nostoc sp. DedQUE12a]|nr:hypothetical protein [Nostoc sp. DedQUE12a]